MQRTCCSAIAILAVAAVSAIVPVAVSGQTLGASAAQTTFPRTPDGQPDIQGIWDPDSTGASHSLELGSESRPGGRRAALAPPLRVSLNQDGTLPYQPWAAAKRRELLENIHTPTEWAHLDPEDRCLLNGVPRSNYRDSTQILQTPGYVVMLYESNHAYRVIPVDGRPHVDDSITLWNGDSRGRWEGRTLVVDVTNLRADATTFNRQPWFDSHGTFYSDALHVVERWTIADADTIQYEATIEDPKVFTRPWTIGITIDRKKERNYEFIEEACLEGERNMENMLSAGRAAKAAGQSGIHTHEPVR